MGYSCTVEVGRHLHWKLYSGLIVDLLDQLDQVMFKSRPAKCCSVFSSFTYGFRVLCNALWVLCDAKWVICNVLCVLCDAFV